VSRTALIVIGVIAAVLIAWLIVDLLFSLVWFVVRLAIVAVFAVIVFLAVRSMLARRSTER
jgi:hypothetical protein